MRHLVLCVLAAWIAPALTYAQENTPTEPQDPHALARELGLEDVEESDDDARKRFKLFNRCAPLGLIVNDLSDDAEAIDLTMGRVRTMAESRLRAARLYDETSAYAYLRVYIAVRGEAVYLEVSLEKILHDSVSDWYEFAMTWRVVSLGTHGGDAGFVLQHLSESLDESILEYLRVNDAAC